MPWLPGTACPRCGSGHYAPVPVIRTGSDYETADRSQGFAIEDVRFGRLAQWAEMITAKQLQSILHEQRQLAVSGEAAPDLGTLLVRKKLMNRHQVQAILSVLSSASGNRDDHDFARAAVQSGYVTGDRAAECRALQDSLARAGRDAPPLALLLYEKRCLQENRALALLKAAESRERGLLYHIRRTVKDLSQSRVKRLLGTSGVTRLHPRLAAALAFFLLLLVVWAYRAASVPATATVRCIQCGAEGGAPENSKWPITCPECGEKAMYPLAVCEECGTRFPVRGIGYGVACPKCNSAHFKMITSELDLKAIEEAVAAGGE